MNSTSLRPLLGLCALAVPCLAVAHEDIELGGGQLLGPEGPLVLEHTQVDADVSAGVAVVTVTQTFANPYDEVIDAHYVMPLPTGAAVRDMRLVCGSRVIDGEIMTREDARDAFEQARSEGRKAALLEQMRDNLFIQDVSALCPGETVEVEVEYVEQLRREDGAYTLVFPTAQGERFDAPPDLEVAPHVPAPMVGGRSVDIDLRIDEGRAFLERADEKYDLIYVANNGAVHASRTGHTRKFLDTYEAMSAYIDQLSPDGNDCSPPSPRWARRWA